MFTNLTVAYAPFRLSDNRQQLTPANTGFALVGRQCE